MSQDYSQILIDQTARLFAQRVTNALLARADQGEWAASLWADVCQAGLPHAFAPESAGGVGLPWSDVAALIRLAGYYAVPLPLPETILANWLWSNAGGEALNGPVVLAPVHYGDRFSLIAKGEDLAASGRARHIPWLSMADHILVYATGPGHREHLCLVNIPPDSGASRRNVANEPRQAFELSDFRISVSDVKPLSKSLGELGIVPFVAAIRAQQIVGAMERCVEFALRYANERVQFGRPIAKFQAIQQMLAVAAGQLAAATAAADGLAETEALDENPFIVAVAKARCSEAVGQVAAICHQVHGAMGFTREHPLHFFTRRLWAWRDEGGSETFWQEWIGRRVSEKGGDALWPMIVDARSFGG